MNDTFMKERPIFPLLVSMALPMVLSMTVNALYNIVDSFFVAQISEQAMTALSLVFPIQNFVNAVAIGFGIGINAQIALYLGAGDHENANRAATHGMMFSLLHGVLGMVLCIAIMPGFLRRFTTDPALVDMGVTYKQRDPNSPKFVTIGERIHCISPVIREAMNTMNPEPILKRAAEQIKAGATYLDVNIGPAESNGPELMTWAVKLLQENFNNVPLALDTANKKAIEAGIHVYNRTNGKPIVNSADAGSRISNIDLAAANDAICIALCSADGIAKDNEERMKHCHNMLERGMSLGMDATDLWFDPLFLVVKGMQDKQMEVLEAIKMFASEGLKSTGGLSNNSNGAPKNVRPIMDSALVAMAMMQGLTSAIVNPNDLRLMETIKSCDIFKNNELYSDSYLDA